MDNNYTQIEKYLQQEMSEAERLAFENRLATDKDFQQEFTVQEQLSRVAINAGIKNEFGKAIRKKILNQQLIGVSVIVVIVASVFLFFAIKNNWFTNHKKEAVIGIEKFEIKNDVDTIIETKNGVVFAIPARAFGSTGNAIQLEIKTALTPNEIMKNGLSTMSNGSLLQTAGMFYINGFEDGKQIPLMKEVAVSVPANNINPAMQLFDGVEDKEGNINWVNPKAIQNNLRTFDITSLDFYPPDYIPTLKALGKKYQDKKYTDSLYYSFSGFPLTNHLYTSEINEADIIVNDDGTGAVGANDGVGGADDYEIHDTIKKSPDTLLNPKKDTTIGVEYINSDATPYEIDPARIKAIWNKRFNNTILATKEFEERLKYIHGLCHRKYLAIYLEGLNKPMYEIDKAIADKSSGDIKNKFLEFAARKDGKVILAEGIQQKLSEYFQKKYQAYQQAAIKTRSKYEAELKRLSTIGDAKKREQGIKDLVRKNQNFEKEFCINLTDAYKQIGVKRSCNDTIVPPTTPFYNITISTTGWYNLDVYVLDATQDRQSITYTDPVTGKTAKLIYRDVAIQVENLSQYDKVLVYLLPDSLNSFQRLLQSGDFFKEKFNSLFRYDAVAIGYKGDKVFYASKKRIQAGNHQLTFYPISEGELNKELNQFSKQIRRELQLELEYQLFAQQEELRQIKLSEELTFIGQIAAAIFKCGRDDQWPENQPAPTQPVNK